MEKIVWPALECLKSFENNFTRAQLFFCFEFSVFFLCAANVEQWTRNRKNKNKIRRILILLRLAGAKRKSGKTIELEHEHVCARFFFFLFSAYP